MQLWQLKQLNFRNLQTQTVPLEPGLTVLVGANGAGKSNFLAACYLALTGSLPYGRIADAIRHDQDGAFVSVRLEHDEGESLIELGLGPGRRTIRLDGNPVRAGELAQVAAAVLMTPEDADMIHGGPALRRAWLDSLLSRMSLRYEKLHSEYLKVLQQRNAMLKNLLYDESLEVWTDRLVQLGSGIEDLRSRALGRLAPMVQAAYAEVVQDAAQPGRDRLEMSLASAGRAGLAEAIAASHAEERARGTTVVGPHRDDLLLVLGGHSLQAFGSRGEARTAALALKVAEYRLLEERHGEAPVLLLDDFTAELDPERRGFLLQLAATVPQAIATGTEAPAGSRVLTVVAGEIG